MRSNLGQLAERLVHGGVLWLTGLLVLVCDNHVGFRIIGGFLILLGMAIGLGMGTGEEN